MEEYIIISLTCWIILYMIIGLMVCFFDRNRIIVNSVSSRLSILQGIIYMFIVIFVSEFTIEGSMNCLVLHWFPVLCTCILIDIIILRIIKIFKMRNDFNVKKRESTMHRTYSPKVPSRFEKNVFYQVNFENEKEEHYVHDMREKSHLGDRSYMRTLHFTRDFFLKNNSWTCVLLVTFVEFIIIIPIVFTIDESRNLHKKCFYINPKEVFMIISLLISVMILTINTVTRKHMNKYFIWNQLILTISSWSFLIITESILWYKRFYFKTIYTKDVLSQIFSISCWSLPFFMDVLWPVMKSNFNEKKNSDDTLSPILNISMILELNTRDPEEENWNNLTEFMVENMNPNDNIENKMFMNCLLFIKEFLEVERESMKYKGKKLFEFDKNENSDIHILFLNTWVKHMRDKGDFTWDIDSDMKSLFHIDFEELRPLKKNFEYSLLILLESKDNYNRELYLNIARDLKSIFDFIVEKTDTHVIRTLKNSTHMEEITAKVMRDNKKNHFL